MDRQPISGRPMFVSPCNRQAAAASKLKVRQLAVVTIIVKIPLLTFDTAVTFSRLIETVAESDTAKNVKKGHRFCYQW